ncbi:Uncharacterised protein [uncultured archaeon]|nr:Uncharacterised protein [uncultured archaeon]
MAKWEKADFKRLKGKRLESSIEEDKKTVEVLQGAVGALRAGDKDPLKLTNLGTAAKQLKSHEGNLVTQLASVNAAFDLASARAALDSQKMLGGKGKPLKDAKKEFDIARSAKRAVDSSLRKEHAAELFALKMERAMVMGRRSTKDAETLLKTYKDARSALDKVPQSKRGAEYRRKLDVLNGKIRALEGLIAKPPSTGPEKKDSRAREIQGKIEDLESRIGIYPNEKLDRKALEDLDDLRRGIKTRLGHVKESINMVKDATVMLSSNRAPTASDRQRIAASAARLERISNSIQADNKRDSKWVLKAFAKAKKAKEKLDAANEKHDDFKRGRERDDYLTKQKVFEDLDKRNAQLRAYYEGLIGSVAAADQVLADKRLAELKIEKEGPKGIDAQLKSVNEKLDALDKQIGRRLLDRESDAAWLPQTEEGVLSRLATKWRAGIGARNAAREMADERYTTSDRRYEPKFDDVTLFMAAVSAGVIPMDELDGQRYMGPMYDKWLKKNEAIARYHETAPNIVAASLQVENELTPQLQELANIMGERDSILREIAFLEARKSANETERKRFDSSVKTDLARADEVYGNLGSLEKERREATAAARQLKSDVAEKENKVSEAREALSNATKALAEARKDGEPAEIAAAQTAYADASKATTVRTLELDLSRNNLKLLNVNTQIQEQRAKAASATAEQIIFSPAGAVSPPPTPLPPDPKLLKTKADLEVSFEETRKKLEKATGVPASEGERQAARDFGEYAEKKADFITEVSVRVNDLSDQYAKAV